MNEALKQLLTLGYDAMSYTTLSKATGISRTGISHHFPHKVNFVACLDPQISCLFLDELDFSSLDTLENSWLTSLESKTIYMILKLFFSLCGDVTHDVTSFKAISLVYEKAANAFGVAGERMISVLLGRSAVIMLSQATEINVT